MRKVGELMSWGPIVVDCGDSLAEATETMARFELRHLPVVDGGRLVGILSERDVHRLALRKHQVEAEVLSVGQAMSPDPFTVAPDAPLSTVARSMAEHHIGAAVVTRGNQIVGIFTTTDALRALASCEEAPIVIEAAPIRP